MRPQTQFSDRTLDAEIAPLVLALRSRDIATLGSCCGHGKSPAYIDFAVRSSSLRAFIERLNQIQPALEGKVFLDVALNWDLTVVTSCDFETHPDWIMLSLKIEAFNAAAAPSRAMLTKVAKLYKAARAKNKPKRVTRRNAIATTA